MLNTNYKGRVYLFLFSQCLTLFGSTLVQMAIVWYVTLATSSGVWVSAFSVCSYLPQFLLSFWGGALADRHSKKRLIIGADSFIAATTLLLALAMPYIQSSNALLVVLLVCRSRGANPCHTGCSAAAGTKRKVNALQWDKRHYAVGGAVCSPRRCRGAA